MTTMRSLLLLALVIVPIAPIAAAVDATPAAAAGSAEATRIAADIIKARALDAAGAGQFELSTQLQALAKGLVDGRISLQEASLVMQIAATPRVGAVVTATM